MREFKSEKAWSRWLYDNELRFVPNSWWFKPPTAALRGVPDFIGCVNGFFVALELKLDIAHLDPSRESLQKHVISKIKSARSPIAIDRCTPKTWDSVKRKLLFLSVYDCTALQNLLEA